MTAAPTMKPTTPREYWFLFGPNRASIAQPMTAIKTAARSAFQKPAMEKPGSMNPITRSTMAETTKRMTAPSTWLTSPS